jgi:putative restriction endonuclease
MAPSAAEELLSLIAGVRRFSRHGYVAPNKPLTLLWALARLEEGESRLYPYAAAEPELQPLLDAYARYRTSPVHAYWALRHDGFWEVQWTDELVLRQQSREPPRTWMREHASAGFRPEAFDLLASDPELRRAATLLLREQLQGGLPVRIPIPAGAGARETTSRLKRDAAFRVGVMAQFEDRCGVCGWQVRAAGAPVGLTAAHVRSLQEGGPDEAGNGFVLCWLHHSLFDAGLFSYDEQRRLIVSGSWREEERGSMPSLRDFAGTSVPEPADALWRVRDEHLAWHRGNVFVA